MKTIEADFESADALLEDTDAKLLRKQRRLLLELLDKDTVTSVLSKQELEALDGISSFLEAVANYMADGMGNKDALLTDRRSKT